MSSKRKNWFNSNQMVVVGLALALVILVVVLLGPTIGEVIRSPITQAECSYFFTLNNDKGETTVTNDEATGTTIVVDKERQFYRVIKKSRNGEVIDSISFSAIFYNEDSVRLLVDRSREEPARRAAQLNQNGALSLKKMEPVETQDLRIVLEDLEFTPQRAGSPRTSSTFCVSEI